jgi:hypothetical protein
MRAALLESLVDASTDTVRRQPLQASAAGHRVERAHVLNALQRAIGNRAVSHLLGGVERRAALPPALRAGVEQLSGIAMDDVVVHYGSAKPASVGAAAYAHGSDIHVGRAQEAHLPHEAWHVVQQKQGRVNATLHTGGVAVNADRSLEHEADVMGARAGTGRAPAPGRPRAAAAPATPVVQRSIEIQHGSGAGIYAQNRTRELLDAVAVFVNYESAIVRRGPLEMLRAGQLRTYRTLYELAEWMTDPGGNLPGSLPVTYDSAHGDYHFTGAVTEKKAQWTIQKAAAQQLMQAEINKHMTKLIRNSRSSGWEPWYIGADAGKDIGDTRLGKDVKPESRFTIQLQVNVKDNQISYHGYPDQRLLSFGAGKTKKSLEE